MTPAQDEVFKRLNIPKPYTVHITRRVLWSDKTNYDAISLREWIDYVNWDPQMKLENQIEFPLRTLGLAKENFIYRCEGLSLWKAHFYGELRFNPSFEHERGNIDVTDPDPETLKKMIAIAGRLEAKVQGDDGKIFDMSQFPEPIKGPWWKFW